MLFYFVRHGETEANRLGLLAGSGLDHPLTEVGHEQALKLGRAIRQHIAHPIHRLWVSNMTRTQQTAQYLADELGIRLELEPDLREWHLGEWEGQEFTKFSSLILGDGEPSQGESRQIFYGRVNRAWNKLHSHTHPYLIVSHGAVWLALQDLLKIPRFKIENCQLVQVQSRNEAWAAKILK